MSNRKKLDEPIKKAITSPDTEGQTYLIYHDGSVKVIQQNEGGADIVIFITAEDMEEINEAIKSDPAK